MCLFTFYTTILSIGIEQNEFFLGLPTADWPVACAHTDFYATAIVYTVYKMIILTIVDGP